MVDFDVVTGSAPPLRLPCREPPPAKDKAVGTTPVNNSNTVVPGESDPLRP